MNTVLQTLLLWDVSFSHKKTIN